MNMDNVQRRFYIGFGDTVGVMATSYAEAVKLARQTLHVDGVAVTLNWDAHTVEVTAALTPARADAWTKVLAEAKAELWRERVREYKIRRAARHK
mgnify:CR=1 FL=1